MSARKWVIAWLDRRQAWRVARTQARIISPALTEVKNAASACPLDPGRLEAALQGAVAAGAERMQAAKAAGIGAPEPGPADFGHRQRVYDVVRRVVHVVPSWADGEDA